MTLPDLYAWVNALCACSQGTDEFGRPCPKCRARGKYDVSLIEVSPLPDIEGEVEEVALMRPDGAMKNVRLLDWVKVRTNAAKAR